MRRCLIAIGLVWFAAILPGEAAFAQSAQGIVAVVNDEVISGYDLDARIQFTVLSAKLPNRPEVYSRLRPQVLNNLIEDSLRLQEASRLGIHVTPTEVENAKRTIEKRNGMPPHGLDNFLTSNGVDRLTLLRQIKAEIAWIKIINSRIRPKVQVGDDEIAEVSARIAASKGKPEHLLSEIFLPFDQQTRPQDVKVLADRLLDQLRQGANFGSLANTFSQSATAARGGDLGWLRNDQLNDAIAPVLERMEPGQVSLPIKAIDGYHIILLRDRRVGAGMIEKDLTVDLQQIFLPLQVNAGESEVQSQTALARQAAEASQNCDDMAKLAKQMDSPGSGRLQSVRIDSMAPELQNILRDLPVNKASEPIRSNAGIVVLMICERHGDVSDEEAAEAIRNSLVVERIELAARRYLRNLKRQAFIEIRR